MFTYHSSNNSEHVLTDQRLKLSTFFYIYLYWLDILNILSQIYLKLKYSYDLSFGKKFYFKGLHYLLDQRRDIDLLD